MTWGEPPLLSILSYCTVSKSIKFYPKKSHVICRYIEYELHHTTGKGEALCHFRWIMSGTLENSFSFLMVLLSVERILLLLVPRMHSKYRCRLVLFCVVAGSWVLSLILATIQMYVTTGGIFYHAESGENSFLFPKLSVCEVKVCWFNLTLRESAKGIEMILA